MARLQTNEMGQVVDTHGFQYYQWDGRWVRKDDWEFLTEHFGNPLHLRIITWAYRRIDGWFLRTAIKWRHRRAERLLGHPLGKVDWWK